MKTLSYYQNLRDDYACIIPKTAPAYELIEALDALITSLQPKEEQPHFLGVPVNLPKGWVIYFNYSSDVITVADSNGVGCGSAYPNSDGEYAIWWKGSPETTVKTQKEAIEWLNREANK